MDIKLIPNPDKQWAVELADELKYYLENNAHAVVNNNAEASICIGGDGTILYSNHVGLLEGAVIGIGSNSSYICQLTKENWKEKLADLLNKGKVNVMTVSAKAGDKTYHALNDFVVHSKDFRVIGLSVAYGDETHGFYADGLVASSALGSAGHAYSAGGDLLRPHERKISVVPIAPYRRAFAPVVLEESLQARVKSEDSAAFIADGVFIKDLKPGEELIIEKGKDLMFFEGVGCYKQG